MSNISFSNFNKEHKEYLKLEELYKKNGKSAVYQIKNIWINTNSDYYEETPVAEIGECNVNIPHHQLPIIKNILKSAEAMETIENGEAGFTIREYEKVLKSAKGKKDTIKLCYEAVFCDVDPEDFPEEEDDE